MTNQQVYLLLCCRHWLSDPNQIPNRTLNFFNNEMHGAVWPNSGTVACESVYIFSASWQCHPVPLSQQPCLRLWQYWPIHRQHVRSMFVVHGRQWGTVAKIRSSEPVECNLQPQWLGKCSPMQKWWMQSFRIWWLEKFGKKFYRKWIQIYILFGIIWYSFFFETIITNIINVIRFKCRICF